MSWAVGCGGPAPRDLAELVVRDSTYYEPTTMEPYTGRVFRTFSDDPGATELAGSLARGTWEGELTIYHPNGRIRYQGEMSAGAPCGAWIEEAPAEPVGSVYEEIVAEIENLSMYPDCDGRQ